MRVAVIVELEGGDIVESSPAEMSAAEYQTLVKIVQDVMSSGSGYIALAQDHDELFVSGRAIRLLKIRKLDP